MIRYTILVMWIGLAIGCLLIAKSLDCNKGNPEYFKGFKAGCNFMVQQMQENPKALPKYN